MLKSREEQVKRAVSQERGAQVGHGRSVRHPMVQRQTVAGPRAAQLKSRDPNGDPPALMLWGEES